MEVGDLIKNRRKELGLTLEQVADQVGVSKSTVRKWETGYIKNMRRDRIAALSKVLNLSPIQLMGVDDLKKDVRLNFSANLKKHIKLNNLTIEDIAAIVQREPSDVISWLNMDSIPTVEEVKLLADYFHVQSSDFNINITDLYHVEILSEEELSLLNMYRSMPSNNKKAVFELMKHLSHSH